MPAPSTTIACACGQLQGTLAEANTVNRGVCYCKDCQAFASHLGFPLDEFGGTEVMQTTSSKVTFTQGLEHLACLRLTSKGLIRWYADCCRTPIANTGANFKVAFVGLHSRALPAQEGQSKDDIFGPLGFRVNAKSGVGTPPGDFGTFKSFLTFSQSLFMAWVSGAYKETPFFDEFGDPLRSPDILA